MREIKFEAGRLPGRSVIVVKGPDAQHFLHNLVTADVDRLGEGEAAYAALLAPQGKILFDFFVVRMGDSHLLDCSRRQQDGLLQRLGFYKLRARVEIAAATDMAVAASLHATEGYPDPRTPDIGWRGFVSPESREAQGYAGARIALGLADSDADLGSGEFFPHEANLDQLGGVSFGKGCYIGQEVVSRMEHRGTARSRILPVALDGEAPAKGSDIRSGDRQIGTLLSASGNSALALIRLDRLAEASAPLLTETVRVHVLKPRWARYDVPQAEGIA